MKRIKTIDRETKKWIRCPADEKAAAAGCRFDGERARFVVYWIQNYCRLYEGDAAGQPLTLSDWQLECTLRLFGWIRWSEKWQRQIRRFRKASIWMAKKNKKSPTLAAWGLYLLCGDGEPGQKVYSTAKDGKQAMISHTHAMEMVKRSPALLDECAINKSTGQITHLPSSSFYKVVAGDNPQSQEGLNGSVMVDETHVVDRRLMKILKGAGISRSEPLQIEVSTAGNDPDGYGKERFDYAENVLNGTFTDQELFVAIYAAPQNLSPADLDAAPLKFGCMANPAMGHTVDPEEYLADYETSKKTMQGLADFMMYRLTIWQKSTNPWLKTSDWEKCRKSYTEDDLAGQICDAGLDLSKTTDMCSLVLAFPMDEPETFRLLPYFWLPQERAQEINHLVPVLAWAAAGNLFLTPGNVVDYGFIRGTFRRLAEKFQIRKLLYDRTYAEETTQTLEQGSVDDEGKTIEEGTGIERLAFPQTLMAFTAPSKDWERLIIAGKLHHNGHPVLTWQVGHVQVRTDYNRNIRPVKPKLGDVKSIDGIIAGVMAVAGVMTTEEAGGGIAIL